VRRGVASLVAVAAVVALVLIVLGALFGPSSHDRGFDWGNFAAGTLSGEGIVDRTQNWKRPHVRILRGAGPNGGNAALLVANDSVVLPSLDEGAPQRVRIHGFRAADEKDTSWFGSSKPHQVAEAISIKVPRGYDNNHTAVTTLELHGDNGTGPAPLNVDFTVGGFFTIIVRGSESTTASGSYEFEQNVFGAGARRATTGGRYYRRERPFVGGNVPVVLGRWVNFRFWWHDLTSDREQGAFTAWVNTAPRSGWRKIVDLAGIRTAYPDVNGDGQVVYPMLSLYYDRGHGGTQAVEYAAGRIEPSLLRLERWQDARLGLR
jgi:hypothetical protein